jgi:Arc/MetJ family transcription regulator
MLHTVVKVTLPIDETLLAHVMKTTETTNKSRAIAVALREWERRSRLVEIATAGLGLSPDELRDALNPNYDLDALRAA